MFPNGLRRLQYLHSILQNKNNTAANDFCMSEYGVKHYLTFTTAHPFRKKTNLVPDSTGFLALLQRLSVTAVVDFALAQSTFDNFVGTRLPPFTDVYERALYTPSPPTHHYPLPRDWYSYLQV
jgi:hypothetical protein